MKAGWGEVRVQKSNRGYMTAGGSARLSTTGKAVVNSGWLSTRGKLQMTWQFISALAIKVIRVSLLMCQS